ncbi:hypothetical protein O181_071400 [Austropuccinia psidii MF-1]|uniref:Reverse transcriptase Ty1/copia-type domain-containing protein n=1 Tax=Austropuccinia psidii MF-1 TaxID=1389203 RepID=A0A9Q3I9Z8_9BASI|nr:hypothetical protein [Austropuccinia psidii MF-1]
MGLKCEFGKGELTISQRPFTNSILDAYPRQIFHHDSPLPVLPEGSSELDPTPFRSFIGSLAYLVSSSRPYLAFAGNYLAQNSVEATKAHWEPLDNVIGYLLKTWGHSLCLCPGKLPLSLWGNAGWGGYLKQSQTGFILEFWNAPIPWGSKQQSILELSTCAV